MAKACPTLLLSYIRHLAGTGDTTELSDRDLVQKFADERDEAAFASLVRRHGPMVLGVCRRVLGNEHDAEDAFQAVFLVLSRKAASLRWKETVGPWLFGVAHRLALRARQQLQSRRKREALAGERRPGDVVAELTVREAQAVLDEEFARLPERERAPLVLCYLQGMTRDEAAERLGCPLGTLKSRLQRARALLQKRLQSRGLAFSAALATLFLTGSPAAAIPSAVMTATVRASLAYASGSASGTLIGPNAAALADWFIRSTLTGKIMVAGFGLLLAAAFVGLALAPAWMGSQGRPKAPLDPVVAQIREKPHLSDARPLEMKEPKKTGDVPNLADPSEEVRTVKAEPPLSPVRFLNLQPHANQKLKARFAAMEGNDLTDLPLGEQILAGVKFNIEEGLIHLRGRGTPYPEKAVGIKVNGKFSRLNVLHATQWDSDKADCLVGYYAVNYEGGHQAKIPMVFCKDVANWWTTCRGPGGAKIAWKGKNVAAAKTQGANLQLYVSMWTNPEPARRVVSIDFVSTNSDVAPFCVAMTVED
jgi:RNA polymerase sigma factor (sigma-70 family)